MTFAAKPVRLLLFDIAGTLIADDARVLRIYREMIADHRLTPRTHAWLLATMGRAKREVFRMMLEPAGAPEGDIPRRAFGLPESDCARTIAALEEEFERRLWSDLDARPPALLPGAARAVAALSARGITTGYTTGFSRRTAERLLAETGLHLEVGAASDEVAQGRPAPDLIFLAMRRASVTNPAEVGVCGDTPGDLEAGARAGCALIVGVLNGTHDRAGLEGDPHTCLLPNLLHFERDVLNPT